MVAIFTGTGAGMERGSAATLGAAGLLGSGTLGRSGQQVQLNAATGNLMVTQRDEMLVGRGPDVAISRTYNSLGDLSDENGDNWRQSTDRRLFGLTGAVNTAGSTLQRMSGDGSVVTYAFNGSAYVATDGAGAYDTITNAGTWVWTDGDTQITETYGYDYNGASYITQQADTSGNALTFVYSGANLTQVTTAGGEWIQYGWAGNTITQVVSGFTDIQTGASRAQARSHYTYDSYSRLASVTVDLSPADNDLADGNGYTTTYEYVGESKLLSAIAESDGSRLDVGYYGANQVVSLIQTVAGGITRTTSIGYGTGFTTVTDPTGQVTRMDYDANGALTAITAPPASAGAPSQVTQFGYTANGDVANVTDASGLTTIFAYDGAGNVLTQTDRLGNVVTRTYGLKNELLTETRIGADTTGAAVEHTTRYAYDAANRLRFVVSADGHVSEQRYDGYGQISLSLTYTDQVVDLSGITAGTALSEAQLDGWVAALADPTAVGHIGYSYDVRGNLTQQVSYGAASSPGNPTTTEGYTHAYFTYDEAGQLLSRSRAGENTEYFVYDGLGRVTASTDLNGGTTTIAFVDASTQTVITLANGLVQTSTYNKAGDLISFTDGGEFAAAGTATYQYDQLGRMRSMTDANGIASYVLYDKAGRKVADVDQSGAVTEYRYDANDRLVATTRYTSPTDPANLITLADPNSTVEMSAIRPIAQASDIWTWHVYDAEGRVVEDIDGSGGVTGYDYDGSGRLVRTTGYANRLDGALLGGFQSAAPATVVLPVADGVRDQVTRLFYDKDGRLVGQLDGEGYLNRTIYNAAGEKVADTTFAGLTDPNYRPAGTFDELLATLPAIPGDRTNHYVYDKQGLLAFAIDGLNHVTEYVYRSDVEWAATGVVRQTIAYAAPIAVLATYSIASVRDALSTGGSTGNVDNRMAFSVFDAANRLAYSIDASGAVVSYSYDTLGQITKTVAFAAVRPSSALPTQTDMDAWAVANSDTANDRITRNYYSDRGELRFVVDAEGYVLRSDYNAGGQLAAIVRFASAIVTDDTTTIDGVNQLATGDYAATTYSYDVMGRMASMTDPIGTIHTYVYYANGTLQWDIVAAGQVDERRTQYAYDGAGRVAAQYDAWGTPEQSVTQFGYDAFGNVTSQIDANTGQTLRTYDERNQLLTQTDAANGVTSFDYDAFGAQVRTVDPRGFATYSYYDADGRTIATRDAEDYVTEMGYSVFGDLTAVTRRYNRAVDVASVGALPDYTADPRDATTTFGYDRLGRAVTNTDAEGATEVTTYGAFGNVTRVQNRLGGIKDFAYNRRGLLVSEYVGAAVYDGYGTQSGTGYFSHVYSYDSRGNIAQDVEASGLVEQRVTNFIYDKADRLVQKSGDAVVTGLFGTTSTTTPIETYGYDARGNVIQTTLANGAQSLFYYDRLDRLVAQITPYGAIADLSGTLTTYGYDANGNRTLARVYDAVVGLPAPGGSAPAAPGGAYRETSFSYDALNRLKTTTIAGVRTGSWDGTSYVTGVGAVTTSMEYDAAGNVVRMVDANGGVTYSYYDRAGRKTAQVDGENYLTAWTLDAEGNALTERRFAERAATIDPSAPPALGGNDAADRITSFSYDRNGRRLTEQRLGVQAWSVNADTGGLGDASGTATIAYTYNALGEVTRKVEATGDYVDYAYDTTGRLTTESRTPFIDLGSTADPVVPTVGYYYNGLGDLVRSVENATRITAYVYTTGGRLLSSIDAAGNTRAYYYDTAGQKIGESYYRSDSNAGQSHDGVEYRYDAAGQLAYQGYAVLSDLWVQTGDTTQIGYNTHGEVTQRFVNGVLQEQFDYDIAGKVWRSTADDGTWRYYVYDGSGNQTLSIESSGADLANQTIDQVLSTSSNGGTVGVGDAYLNGITATITIYDKRNQAIGTRLPQRQLYSVDVAATQLVSRTYDAFGDMVSEVDALGYTTSYAYNALGRTVTVTHPQIDATNEQGVTVALMPVEHYFYDLSGRRIGTQDANGNVITQLLQQGTGYNDTEALITKEFHPDGGIIKNNYNVFGDLTNIQDENGQSIGMTYDGMGRLTQTIQANGVSDDYTYDILGQRIRHTSSALVSVERTDYDIQGRITSQVAFGGDTTSMSYQWNGGYATAGLGTQGGWLQTTTFANGRTSLETTDVFAHVITKTDLGGHVFDYTYDRAGRLSSVAGNGQSSSYYYLNTGLVGGVSVGVGDTFTPGSDHIDTTYAYDARGNKTGESTSRTIITEFSSTLTTLQAASAIYDALGRMTSWTESGNPVVGNNATPPANTVYRYDANGNIREASTSFTYIGQDGVPTTSGYQDYWYRYDSMNRVVTDKGALANGQIVRGATGTDITYDGAGLRRTATTTETLVGYSSVFVYYPDHDPQYGYPLEVPEEGYNGEYQQLERSYEGERQEAYGYDGMSRLSSVAIAETGFYDDGAGNVSSSGVLDRPAGGASYGYDVLGRQNRQIDSDASGASVYDRTVAYDEGGRATSETVTQRQGSDTLTTNTTTDYGTGVGYALGAPVTITSSITRNGAFQATSQTVNGYEWYDSALQGTITYQPDVNVGTVYTTTTAYTGAGVMRSAYIADGRPRTVTYETNAIGQVIRRDEAELGGSNVGPHEVWYRFDSRQIGHVSNDGTLETDYTTSIADRTAAQGTGPFRNGSTYGTQIGEFDGGYEPITSYNQGSGGGSYTVRADDTLASIAQALWGDPSLWYKLAQANGIGADNRLVEGQILTIPPGVIRSANNASTFRPYDPAAVIGDNSPTSPTTPKPQATAKKNKCGVFGKILLIAVAVAVAAVTFNAALGTAAISAAASGTGLAVAGTGLSGALGATGGAIAAGALAGAAGSIASQGVGVVTGLQDGFSFKGVALAALAGGVGGGLGVAGLGKVAGSPLLGNVARGVVGSTLTQGVSVVAGLQSKFDFVGVAVGGAVGGVGGAINLSGVGGRLVSGTVGALAGGAARSLLNGSDFGDNVLAALPEVIGSTIGGLVASGLSPSRSGNATGMAALQARNRQNASEDALPLGTRNLVSDAQDAGSGEPDIVVVGQRMTALEAFLYDLQVGNITSAVLGGLSLAGSLISNPGGTITANVRPSYLDGVSRVLTGAVQAVDGAYQRSRDYIDRNTPRSGLGYYATQVPLALADFDEGFLNRTATGLAALPGAIGNPGRTLQGAVMGLANGIDSVLLDDRSAYRVAGDAYAGLSANTIRQNFSAAGAITADVAAFVGPVKIGAGRAVVGVERVVGGRAAISGVEATENVGARSATARVGLNPQLIAEEVASGHALAKHLAAGEFAPLGVRTKGQFQNFVEGIVGNPATAKRYASDGTTFYIDDATRTVVIRGQRGEATAFRPDYGVGWDDYIATLPKNARSPGYDPVPSPGHRY
jgi:YD repeat-containing protein